MLYCMLLAMPPSRVLFIVCIAIDGRSPSSHMYMYVCMFAWGSDLLSLQWALYFFLRSLEYRHAVLSRCDAFGEATSNATRSTFGAACSSSSSSSIGPPGFLVVLTGYDLQVYVRIVCPPPTRYHIIICTIFVGWCSTILLIDLAQTRERHNNRYQGSRVVTFDRRYLILIVVFCGPVDVVVSKRRSRLKQVEI